MEYFADGRIQINGEDETMLRLLSHGSPYTAPNPAQYERAVIHLLADINGNPVGHILISAIRRIAGRTAFIVPAPTVVDSAAVRLASASDESSDVGVPFSLETANEAGMPTNTGAGAAAFPSAVLLHELVHALRRMRGSVNMVRMEDGLDNREEFYAILIANIYCSTLSRSLRLNHHGFRTFDATGVEGMMYFARYHRHIAALREERDGVGLQTFTALAQVRTFFNPIRDFVRHATGGQRVDVQRWYHQETVCPTVAPQPPQSLRSPALNSWHPEF